MQKWLLFLLLSVIGFNKADAQDNCSCTAYNTLQNSGKNDSLIARQLMLSTSYNCKAKGCELMANWFLKINKTDSIEFFLQQAVAAYRKTNCGDSVLLFTYKYWGQYLQSKGDFPNAQEKYLSMLTAAEAANNIYETALGYTMVAQMFNQTNQAPQGIVYTRKAIGLADKIVDPIKKADIYFKISKRLLWHYQDTKIISSLDSSELFSNKQLSIARELHLNNLISTAFSNLQGVEFERHHTIKAMILLDSAFKYTDTSNYPVIGSLYSDKANYLIELKEFAKAKIMTDSSIYYREKTGNIGYKVFGYEQLSFIYKEQRDYKNAYDYYVKARVLKDSLSNIDKTKEVTELERKYSQAKNENIIKDLDKRKQLYLFLAIAGLLTATTIAFFLRQQSLKHKKDILETEQRLNRARMNPHFFFNALTALQKFALRENDGQAMASNLSKFSNIMRETLESTYKEYVTIEQEMEFLNEYLEVQKIRFPQTFSYEVIADKELDIDELQIPAMIIQPFVENSIEHGFVGADYPGNVAVNFSIENNELLIKIVDNGKGLSATIKGDNEHISRASQIIKDRIYLLNIKLKTKAGFSIDNNSTGKGVIVKIHLPLLYKDQKNN